MFEEGQNVRLKSYHLNKAEDVTVEACGTEFSVVKDRNSKVGLVPTANLEAIEQTKHIHAELMLTYALDAMESDKPYEMWEFNEDCPGSFWLPLADNPIWDKYFKYRRKLKTIRIGNHTVPEPLKEAPTYSCKVYKVALDTQELVTEINWEAWMITTDCSMFSKRLVHLNKEAATLHAKALLSFTTTE